VVSTAKAAAATKAIFIIGGLLVVQYNVDEQESSQMFSGLPLIADMGDGLRDFRLVPSSGTWPLFDHLIEER
jgi:hypothetical protein